MANVKGEKGQAWPLLPRLGTSRTRSSECREQDREFSGRAAEATQKISAELLSPWVLGCSAHSQEAQGSPQIGSTRLRWGPVLASCHQASFSMFCTVSPEQAPGGTVAKTGSPRALLWSPRGTAGALTVQIHLSQPLPPQWLGPRPFYSVRGTEERAGTLGMDSPEAQAEKGASL